MAKKAQTKRPKMNYRPKVVVAIVLVAIIALMTYKLGSIMHGITPAENSVASSPLGLRGIYHDPLNLPLSVLRSADFKLLQPVGQTLLRLPNAIVGGATIIAFYFLLWLWYGTRTAAFGAAMFATSAWTLHVSRYTNNSVDYLMAMTFFLLSTAILQKHPSNKYVYTIINLLWGVLLYIPGMVWFIGFNIWRQRRELKHGKRQQEGALATPLYYLSSVIWIPLLAINFLRVHHSVLTWLGLPTKFSAPLTILKNFFAVFVHIFVRGPQYPYLWLGKAPILDLFSSTLSTLTPTELVYYLPVSWPEPS